MVMLIVQSDERENSRKWCKKRGLEEQRFYEVSGGACAVRTYIIRYIFLHVVLPQFRYLAPPT
jgi:hypothetical protein